MIKPTTICLLLNFSIQHGWSLIDPNQSSHVCHLKKALYGLKQAPCAWYHELRLFLLSNGFVNSRSNTSLFILQQKHLTIFMSVYIDDLIIQVATLPLFNRLLHN